MGLFGFGGNPYLYNDEELKRAQAESKKYGYKNFFELDSKALQKEAFPETAQKELPIVPAGITPVVTQKTVVESTPVRTTSAPVATKKQNTEIKINGYTEKLFAPFQFFKDNPLHHSNHYDLFLNPSENVYKIFSEELGMDQSRWNDLCSNLCVSIDVPSFAILTQQVKTYGEFFEMPTNRQYDTLNIRFYSDADMELYTAFHLWQNQVFDTQYRCANFLDDYAGTCYVQFNARNDKSMSSAKNGEVMFEKIWPKSVGAISLSGDQSTTITQFNVVMQYRRARLI